MSLGLWKYFIAPASHWQRSQVISDEPCLKPRPGPEVEFLPGRKTTDFEAGLGMDSFPAGLRDAQENKGTHYHRFYRCIASRMHPTVLPFRYLI